MSDNILLKWSQTVALLVSVPLKKSACRKYPESTVNCVPCMFEHVCYEPCSLKNCTSGKYLIVRESCCSLLWKPGCHGNRNETSILHLSY